MNVLRNLVCVALALGTFFGLQSVARAYPPKYHNSRTYHSNRSYHYNTRVYRYGRGYSPVNRARADIMRANAVQAGAMRAAQAEKYRASQAMHKARAKMERDFNVSPKVSQAQADLIRTSRELTAAKAAV